MWKSEGGFVIIDVVDFLKKVLRRLQMFSEKEVLNV